MFSRIVLCGNRLKCWNTMPIFCRCISMFVSLLVISVPSKKMLPLDGTSNKFRERKNVDFPDPDGPTITTTSPFRIVSETPFKACSEFPNTLCTSFTSIKTSPLVITVSQPPLQHINKFRKDHNHYKINHRNSDQRHKCIVCTASDNVSALCQIFQCDVTGNRRLF